MITVAAHSELPSVMRGDLLVHKEVTSSIIGAFFEVYNIVGFGLLAQNYVKAMECELLARGHTVAREVTVPFLYNPCPESFACRAAETNASTAGGPDPAPSSCLKYT